MQLGQYWYMGLGIGILLTMKGYTRSGWFLISYGSFAEIANSNVMGGVFS